MDDTQIEAAENTKDVEVAPALITVHPSHHSVAVAVGSDLRVFHLRGDCGISLTDDSAEPFHKDSIRAIRYSKSGKLLVSAGDDKLVKIWCTNSWRCISSVSSEKRVTAVAVSNDELYVCIANKFGVVWVVDLHEVDGENSLSNKKPVPLLAHYCSIITSLEFSPDGQFILSADRDFKIRVTVFPKKPLEGAHEIQSFCLGHTEFVSCLAFVCTVDYPQGLLVSGSGDSTVRLWDITSGSLLDTCEVGAGAELMESTGNDEACFSVTDLCTIAGSGLVAVAIQSLQGIMLLKCDLSSKTLKIIKVVPIKGETFIPTSLGSSSSEELLWMVTGVSKLQGCDYNSLARVRVISSIEKGNLNSSDPQLTVLGDDEIPGSKKLLEKLQGNVSIEEKVFLAAAEAVKTAMCKLLIKKHYPSEKRDFRKRTRNDRKSKK